MSVSDLKADHDALEAGLELALKIFVAEDEDVTEETVEKFLVSVVHMRLRGQISQDLAVRLMGKGNVKLAALQIEDHRRRTVAAVIKRGHNASPQPGRCA